MVLNDRLELQLWASEFFLTERLPEHIMDPDTSWDDFDIWIEEHIAEPFQDMAPSEVWNLIWELANYSYSMKQKCYKEGFDDGWESCQETRSLLDNEEQS